MNKLTQQLHIVTLLITLKIVLALFYINDFSIDLDEPFSIYHAQKDFGQLLELFKTENNPPLHFILLKNWIYIFGISPISVRSLSLLFSVLTIPILYLLGKKLHKNETGVVLCLFFILSNFHHYHSIESRGYSLFVFLFVVMLYLLIQFFQNPHWKKAVGISLIFSLLFYTHYIAPIVIGTTMILITILSFIQNTREKRQFLLKNTFFLIAPLTILFSLPLLFTFIKRLVHVSQKGTWVKQAEWSELYGFINKFFNDKWVIAVIIFWLLILFIFLLKKAKTKSVIHQVNTPLILLLFIGCFSYIGTFILSRFFGYHFFLDRYLFFVSIPFFVFVAYITTHISQPFKPYAYIPLVVFSLFFNPSKGNNRETDKLAAYLQENTIGSILIAPPSFDITLLYHLHPQLFKEKINGRNLFDYSIYPIYSLSEVDLTKLSTPIWFIDAASEFELNNTVLKDEILQSTNIQSQKTFKDNYQVYQLSLKNKDVE